MPEYRTRPVSTGSVVREEQSVTNKSLKVQATPTTQLRLQVFKMNTIVIVALLAAVINAVTAGEGMKCKGMDMKAYEQDQMWAMECMKEVNAKTHKEAAMMPCFRKCMVIKRGFADEKGMGNKERAAEFVKSTAPDAVHGDLVPKAEKCVETMAAKIKEGGMSCDAFVPLCQCMADVYMETCAM